MRRSATVAAVMIVRDVEDTLGRALASVVPLVDQVVIVDTGSVDGTRAVVEEAREAASAAGHAPGGFILGDFEWIDDFSAARNHALSLATTDWVLHVDSDEEVAKGGTTLRSLLGDKYRWGYMMRVINAPGADRLAEAAGSSVAIRLFRRRPELIYHNRVHEQVHIAESDRIALCDLSIVHFGGFTRDVIAHSDRNIALLHKAIEEQPESGYYRYSLGNELLARKEFSEAAQIYSQAVQMGAMAVLSGKASRVPLWHPSASRGLAWCLARTGHVAEARRILDQAIKAYPDFTDLYYALGRVMLVAGDLSQAAELFRHCLQMGEPPPHYFTWGGTGSWRSEKQLAILAGMQP